MIQLVEPITNQEATGTSVSLGAEEKPQPSARSTNRSSARALLAARGLRKTFGGQVVLDGVDLHLREGEVVLLRGENGSGKTTLLNILTGSLEPDAGTIVYSADDTPRTYCFPRRWWQELNPWDHFRPEFVAMEGMGRTWQDVRLFQAQSLRDNIAVATPGQPGENPVLAIFAPGRVRRTEREICEKADAMLARLRRQSLPRPIETRRHRPRHRCRCSHPLAR
jgi:ABC-type branched-subunit amino acid transport system ATPase component